MSSNWAFTFFFHHVKVSIPIPIVAGVWAAPSSSSEELPTSTIAGASLEAKYEEVCLLIFLETGRRLTKLRVRIDLSTQGPAAARTPCERHHGRVEERHRGAFVAAGHQPRAQAHQCAQVQLGALF